MTEHIPELKPIDYGLNRALYERKETAEQLAVGNTKLHELINEGELTPIKIGRKTLFTALDIAGLLNRRRQAALVRRAA